MLLGLAGDPAPAQNQIATQDIWALDFNDAKIYIFSGGGQPIGTPITLAGTGSVRGLGFNAAGLAYVARGSDVRTYDGTSTALFAGVAAGITQAQHVAVRPGSAQEVWVAAGTLAANSKIIKFSATGMVIQTLTSNLLDHPRRIAWNQDGSKLFIASNGNKKIVTLDPVTGMFT
jgi:DNA-binding beta-propeller fold protein YncE